MRPRLARRVRESPSRLAPASPDAIAAGRDLDYLCSMPPSSGPPSAKPPRRPKAAANPAAAGPAGPRHEVKVIACYLLAMLLGGQARGLPGAGVVKVACQQAAAGYPLDDVVVFGQTPRGEARTLEIQGKRTVDFTAGDVKFGEVVVQLLQSADLHGAEAPGHWRAVALARTSTPIERAYQQVLAWARDHGSAEEFVGRLRRPGQANLQMRGFLDAFEHHLRAAGRDPAPELVWQLLRSFLILPFDFEAPGSGALDAVLERARMALASGDVQEAQALWSHLTALALELDASGGSIEAQGLRDRVEAAGFALAGAPDWAEPRRALAEAAQFALGAIRDHMGGIRALRAGHLARLDEALQSHRYVELRGASGGGKSALLKALARRVSAESEIILLNDARTIGGGWLVFRNVIGCAGVGAEAFLADFAASGGATLFIDGIDQIVDGGKQATINDLIQAARGVPGFRIVTTARHDFGREDRGWLAQALGDLPSQVVEVPELQDDEAGLLAAEDPTLRLLLEKDHPACLVARNLFHLSRLLSGRDPGSAGWISEAALAGDWWRRGGGGDTNPAARLRALRGFAGQVIGEASELLTKDLALEVIEALVQADTLAEVRPGETARFVHDVLRDWAVGGYLAEDRARAATLPLQAPAPATLVRGVEMAARLCLEREETPEAWFELLKAVSGPGAHGSWKRAVLLALVRSEVARLCLDRAQPLLLANGAALLVDLLYYVQTVETQTLQDVLRATGNADLPGASLIVLPGAAAWGRLSDWLLKLGDALPPTAIPAAHEFLRILLIPMAQFPARARPYVERVFQWLWAFEQPQAANGAVPAVALQAFGKSYHATRAQIEALRATFLAFCEATPELARTYARAWADQSEGRIDDELLKQYGALAKVAPNELADYTIRAIVGPEERERRSRHGYFEGGRPDWRPFDISESTFLPPSPAQGPFFALLKHAPDEGLRVIEALTDHLRRHWDVQRPSGGDVIEIDLPGGQRRFTHPGTYGWTRNPGPYTYVSALMALEAWGHQQLETGRAPDEVMALMLGEGDQPAARLSVALDLVLSHWDLLKAWAIPLAGSPELLRLDRDRAQYDEVAYRLTLRDMGGEPPGEVTLKQLAARPSRGVSLLSRLPKFLFDGDTAQLDVLRARLETARARFHPPRGEPVADPGHDLAGIVDTALDYLDPANWRAVQVRGEDGITRQAYQYQEPQRVADALASKRQEVNAQLAESNRLAALQLGFEGSASVPPETLADAMAWAQAEPFPQLKAGDEDDFDLRSRARSFCMGAALVCEQAAPDEAALAWARRVFEAALQDASDPFGRSHNSSIAFNVAAIAVRGLIADQVRRPSRETRDRLLAAAQRAEPAVAAAFANGLAGLHAADDRLAQGLLRLGLGGARYRARAFDETPEKKAQRDRRHADQATDELSAVRAWLDGGPQPAWPAYPMDGRVGRRRSLITLGGGPPAPRPTRSPPPRPTVHVDKDHAGLWLAGAALVSSPEAAQWQDELLAAYWPFTRYLNGGDLLPDDDEDTLEDGPSNQPYQWNDGYFRLLARRAVAGPPDRREAAVEHLTGLPDGAFLVTCGAFLAAYEAFYFGGRGLDRETLVAVRASLAARLIQTTVWSRMKWKADDRMETRLFGTVCAFSAQIQSFGAPVSRLGEDDPHAPALFPALTALVEDAPQSAALANLTLNQVALSRSPQLVPFVARMASAWLAAHADGRFWKDWGVGERLCSWIHVMLLAGGEAGAAVRAHAVTLIPVLDRSIGFGVLNARAAEDALLAPN